MIALVDNVGRRTLSRLEPLYGGRATEIDMIEREMEGGVVVIQPLDVYDSYTGSAASGLLGVEGDIRVHDLEDEEPTPPVGPTD